MLTQELSIWYVYERFWRESEKTMIDIEMNWHDNRFYRKMWELREENNSGLRIEYEVFGMSEEIELGIIIFREISMPIEMIGMEIGENCIVGVECTDMVRHKTRYFENYVPLLLSFFMYFREYISESSSEITTEVDRSVWQTSMKEMK